MNKLCTLFTLCTLFVTISASYGVDIKYLSGQHTASSTISGTDETGPIRKDDSEIFTENDADTGIDIANTYSSSNANSYLSIYSFPDCTKQLADMHISCSVGSQSYYENSDINVESSTTTANEPESLGYFLEIIASEDGEKTGDKVSISMTLEPYINISGVETYAWMKGPAGRDHFCIALNPEYGEDGMPTEETIIYSHENVLTNTSFSDSGTIEFEARIGDEIGIFLEVGCSTHQTTTDYKYASISTPIYLEMEMLKNSADINNDGYVNMLDVAILANNWLWSRADD